MEWIGHMNAALQYLEDNLTSTIDEEELGHLACCSAYHFRRMFGYMAGMSLSEYLRLRKMSLAAEDLQKGGAKIIDIAAKYGYESPTAFNRAFQSVHGFPPSQAKEPGRTLKSFPPITFQLTVKGAVPMEYRIEEKAPFRILGRSVAMSGDIEENFSRVPDFWAESAQNGLLPQLAAHMNSQPMGILGVSTCDDRAEDWRYYICVASTDRAEDLETYVVPAFTWAVFPGSGTSQSMQELERRIVTEWLPGSGYEYADGPDVEVYLNPDPANAAYEVWIPVVKGNEKTAGTHPVG